MGKSSLRVTCMKGGESKALVQRALLFYGIKRLGRKTFRVVVYWMSCCHWEMGGK